MLRYRNIARISPRELPNDASLARAHALGFDAIALAGGRPGDVGRAAAGGLGVLLDLPAGEIEPWLEAGVVGFLCEAAHERPPASWKRLTAEVRGRYPGTLFLAFTFGATPAAVAALAQCGFDAAASSSCWWDLRAAWIDEDAARVEALGEVIALAEPPSGPRPATERERRRALMLAAHYAPFWMMTLGFEAGLEAEGTALNARRLELAELFAGPPARLVSAPGAEVAVLARGSRAAPRFVLALNPNPDEASTLPVEVVLPGIGGNGGTLVPLDEAEPAHGPIAAGGTFEVGPAEARAFRVVPAKPIRRADARGPTGGPAHTGSRNQAQSRSPDRKRPRRAGGSPRACRAPDGSRHVPLRPSRSIGAARILGQRLQRVVPPLAMGAEISQLNQIRRANPALHSHRGIGS